MNYIYSLGFILSGSIMLYITYKDCKHKRASLSTAYALRGFIASIAFIIMGLMLLSKELENAVIIKTIFRLLVPLIGIVVGFILKMSKKEKYKSVRKYWLLFVIMGTIIFLFRLLFLLA